VSVPFCHLIVGVLSPFIVLFSGEKRVITSGGSLTDSIVKTNEEEALFPSLSFKIKEMLTLPEALAIEVKLNKSKEKFMVVRVIIPD